MKQIKTWALLPLASLCMSSNTLAQTTNPWTTSTSSIEGKTDVSLSSEYVLKLKGTSELSYNMSPKDDEAIINLSFSRYYTALNTNILYVDYAEGPYKSCILSKEGNLTLGGSTFKVRGLSIEEDRDNGCWRFNSKEDMGSNGAPINHPLWFTASQYNFTGGGSMSIDGHVEMESSLSVKKGIYCDDHITSSNLLRIGSTLEGDLSLELQKDTANKAYKISTVGRMGSRYPLNFTASQYNFTGGGDFYVDGTITCKKQMKVVEINSDQINTKDIKVEMNNAADYVFDESYDLKPLNEVETFVKNEKHLPGIPSASEMAKEGMSVSQMSNLLLEKVEELTLHMIEMQKQIDELKAENQSLKEGMNK